jgi:hypothetical protein
MAEVRRLALALSVMEQVAVARDQLKLHDDDYGNARDSAEVRRRIYEMRRDRVPFGENDELERIRAALAAVLAQIREDRAYATLQKTYGELLASIGIDQFPEGLDLGSPQAAAAIERHLSEVPRRVQELSARIAEERRRSAEAKK